MTGTRHDYARQATLYDDTRSASPSILRPLLAARDGAPGPRLLDVGGGTGNYARAAATRGFEPVVVDVAPAMLARARRGSRSSVATRPRCRSAPGISTRCCIVSMRTWRPTGRARSPRRGASGRAVGSRSCSTREHRGALDLQYFPRRGVARAPASPTAAALPDARVLPFEFDDVDDGALAALCRRPELILDPTRRARTSYFERLAASDPAELARGLDRLAHDLARGRRPDEEIAPVRARWGVGAVLAWRKP